MYFSKPLATMSISIMAAIDVIDVSVTVNTGLPFSAIISAKYNFSKLLKLMLRYLQLHIHDLHPKILNLH